jgi:hypothetical protein
MVSSWSFAVGIANKMLGFLVTIGNFILLLAYLITCCTVIATGIGTKHCGVYLKSTPSNQHKIDAIQIKSPLALLCTV